uniref:Fungal_trans domain-containing protein n=1 Tax=Panagrellus redivivus TaxID=6233 RepID=A0A7E4W7B8_PANRE
MSFQPAVMDNGVIPFPPFKVPLNMPSNVIRGCGKLTWLSSKAGLIAAISPSPSTVSFQLKDFCDQGVTDLTTVLRTGFVLSFQALPSETNDWIANHVQPLTEQDLKTIQEMPDQEINLEQFDQGGNSNRDPYSIEMESQSIVYLLQLFMQARSNIIPLSNLHSRISNSGNDELYRYIGSSSLKRRQFIERRSYIFGLTENDAVYLQPPEIYSTVCMLAGFLLCRGGSAYSDQLFSYFHANNNISRLMKEGISNHRSRFVEFLNLHPFVFSPFPAKFCCSVRRSIPYFDYVKFIKTHFPMYMLPNVQKNISYCNTSSVAVMQPYGSNGYGPSVPMMSDDPLTPGPRTPTSSWTANDPLNTMGAPAAGVVPPLSAAMPPSSRSAITSMPPLMNGASSNDFGITHADVFSTASPPLGDFKSQRSHDIGVQASGDTPIGMNVNCTCKCNCGGGRVLKDAERRDENGFIPFYNPLPLQSLPLSGGNNSPTHDISPPGGFDDKQFFSRPIKIEKGTFSAAPGGPVSRTTSSSQTPIDETKQAFDPFAFHAFEPKLRSLKL